MSRILYWNCRGNAHASTVQELRAMARTQSPDFVALAKTKCNEEVISRCFSAIGFTNFVGVPAVGLSGGFFCA